MGRAIGLIVIGIVIGFVAALATGFLDPDTSFRFGNDTIGYFQKSASASSPFAKCKQRQSALEAIMSGETADLSRVSVEIVQLQKKADDTAM